MMSPSHNTPPLPRTMQHVFSLGSVFRASPFVNYHHQPSPTAMDGPAITPIPEPPKNETPPPPPPPQQKLLIKLRVSDLGTKPRPSASSSTAGDVDEPVDGESEPAPPVATTKRRGGGAGTRGKRRKVDGAGAPGTPTSDDGLSVAWDSSASASGTPAKRGRGKGSRGGGTGRGRGGRKSGLQHQVLPVPIPGTPDSVGELSLRPASPSSESTSNNALTPTPISTPTIPIPTSSLALPPGPSSLSTPAPLQPQPSTPAEIDPALLATAPRRPLPTRAFPVQAAPKTTQPAITVNGGPAGGMDLNRRRVRRWGVKMREVKGVGGGSWWVRTWVGSPESEYASDPTRILSVPTTLPRSSTTAPKPRRTDSSRSIPTSSAPKIKLEVPAPPPMGTFGGSHYRDRDQEGVELLTAFASSSRKTEPEGGKGWGGIGAKHYRDYADPGSYRERERDREYYRAEGSSGASTPGVPVPVVKYDLARDGIEEVAPPPVPGGEDIKGKGKEVVVNGKGKEREKIREDVAPPIDREVERETGPVAGPVERAVAGEGRGRSGSSYEQAARDVEMELMGES
ncbi:hypothetical protein FRC08_009586 [Ceratobasidium sp. 394]|nr:hypothetical protein FRC08_009586 [Ceratobasidium sp. 394]